MPDPTSASPGSPIPESWTTKEVIADLKADLVKHLDTQDEILKEINAKVDTKADKTDITALGIRIDGISDRVVSLEEHRTADIAAKRFHRTVWTVIGSVATISAIIAAALIGLH